MLHESWSFSRALIVPSSLGIDPVQASDVGELNHRLSYSVQWFSYTWKHMNVLAADLDFGFNASSHTIHLQSFVL